MSRLVERLQAVDGAEVRLIARLTTIDFEVEFVRDDLAGLYTEDDLDRAYTSVMANQVSTDDFRNVGEFGELDCQLLLFEDIVAFQFPSSRYRGLFVSFDRGQPFPLFEVVDAVKSVRDAFDDSSA